jgi:hypothetical protein
MWCNGGGNFLDNLSAYPVTFHSTRTSRSFLLQSFPITRIKCTRVVKIIHFVCYLHIAYKMNA